MNDLNKTIQLESLEEIRKEILGLIEANPALESDLLNALDYLGKAKRALKAQGE